MMVGMEWIRKNGKLLHLLKFNFCVYNRLYIRNGANVIIQPGGSVKDKDSIQAVNEKDSVMVFTGVRCFFH